MSVIKTSVNRPQRTITLLVILISAMPLACVSGLYTSSLKASEWCQHPPLFLRNFSGLIHGTFIWSGLHTAGKLAQRNNGKPPDFARPLSPFEISPTAGHDAPWFGFLSARDNQPPPGRFRMFNQMVFRCCAYLVNGRFAWSTIQILRPVISSTPLINAPSLRHQS